MKGCRPLWLVAPLVLCTSACGEEELPTTGQRGAPAFMGGGKGGDASKPAKTAAKKGGGGEDEEEEALPERPKVPLDSKSFLRRRDPFQSFQATEVVVPEPDAVRAERPVVARQYAFENLRLVAIVNAGRGIVPRALFLASDGKSFTIKQGQYFSSAEVLLAAVNREYVEIEVVDDELASGLNLQRGERRAIYLRND